MSISDGLTVFPEWCLIPLVKAGKYVEISLYLGAKLIGEIRLEALKEEAEKQRRSITDVIILAIEEGPSKELQEAFKKARERFK